MKKSSSTIGGNWKEFWLEASRAGGAGSGSGSDLALIEYHLKNGVDPNFQHPEMESTALCEAVRAGNADVVDFLLKYADERGDVVVDPTIPSAYENQTPLEIAVELRRHAIVDLILEALPPGDYAEESKYCKQVLVSVPDENVRDETSQLAAAVAEQALELGHRVVANLPPEDEIRGNGDGVPPPAVRKQETRNGKLWSVSSVEEIPSLLTRGRNSRIAPSNIDVWFHFLSAEGTTGARNGNPLDLGLSEFARSSSFLAKENQAPREVWIGIPSTHLTAASDKRRLISFLQRAPRTNAVVVPCSWWDKLWRGGTLLWIETEMLCRLLNTSEGGVGVDGNIYNHKLEVMPWAKTTQ